MQLRFPKNQETLRAPEAVYSEPKVEMISSNDDRKSADSSMPLSAAKSAPPVSALPNALTGMAPFVPPSGAPGAPIPPGFPPFMPPPGYFYSFF